MVRVNTVACFGISSLSMLSWKNKLTYLTIEPPLKYVSLLNSKPTLYFLTAFCTYQLCNWQNMLNLHCDRKAEISLNLLWICNEKKNLWAIDFCFFSYDKLSVKNLNSEKNWLKCDNLVWPFLVLFQYRQTICEWFTV